MSLRQEFVTMASGPGANIRQVCRQFGISPKTGYKWLERYRVGGLDSLTDRSRRPHHSPRRSSAEVEQAVLAVREAHPAWGGRKIAAVLARPPACGGGQASQPVASPSTITEILRRHEQLTQTKGSAGSSWQRFEHEAPNQLWQMDFKGHFALVHGRCHPLTVLDDHSRFALGLRACADERGTTVQQELTAIFRAYGLPARISADNGSPWGDSFSDAYTRLTVWLLRLGVRVSHSRPYHPQTQGKDERFHRTLQAELLHGRVFADQTDCQLGFDGWRDLYNLQRPHQALGMATPASRYHPSNCPFPDPLPPIDYLPGDFVRQVQDKGYFSFRGHSWPVSQAFKGCPIAVRPSDTDGVFDIFFCRQAISRIDLRTV